MSTQTKKFTTALSSSLLLSLLALAGCDKPAVPKTDAAAVAPAAQPAPYTPPTADQLSQMVAPIALFPDKLVGQVLAGATYPQQITAANQWLGQNPSLKGEALQAAESNQPWDVSVKSLTTFPSVLDQMASNIQWTTSLGEAYVNDPTDVMNAIQVLRSRAQQSGNLKTSQHLRVSSSPRSYAPSPAPQDYVASSPSEPRVYDGPAVIHAPPQTIVIESAQPDVVYVPQYDPAVVYGEPVRVYPGWSYHQPTYATSTLVETGALTFGIGVLVGAAVSHHDGWGWNSWGVNWGGPDPYRGYDHGWHRPAVVYNNATYVSKSVTVVNRVNNVNVTNNTVNNNSYNSNVGNKYVTNNVNSNNYRAADNHYQTTNNIVNRNQPIAMNAAPAAAAPRALMSMPHFTPHDAVPGARPPAPSMQAQLAPPQPRMNPGAHMNQLGAVSQPHMNQLGTVPQPHMNQLGAVPQPHLNQLATQQQNHANQLAAAPHMAQTEHPQPMPQPHQARETERGFQTARMERPEINAPVREEAKLVAREEHRQPAMDRAPDGAMRERIQQEHRVVDAAPPVQHSPPPMQNRPPPQHDSNLDRQQANAVRQDVLAMHPPHVRSPEPAQARHAENHAEHGHAPEKHEKHAG